MITNIKILVVNTGEQIDYINAEDLGLKMNRVAIDLTKPDSRFGEYSFSFSIPRTRNNEAIMQYAGVRGVKNIFKINPIDIKVFNNDKLLLSGQLELQEIEAEKYKCVLYSKLTQLVDDLKDKNMQEIQTCPTISSWDYETTIRNHINAGYKDCDETPYQFPLVYYNTFYAPTSIFTGLTDTIIDSNGTTAHVFQRERDAQNWYYMLNHTSLGENEVYFHQIPLAFYLKPMMEYMLSDIGWSMGGSFWEDPDIKKIIVPYVGDTDVYDRAVVCDNGGWISGNTCYTGYSWSKVAAGSMVLQTNKFMPDYNCQDFLEDIIKLFNLYMIIDINQKTIIFETYDTMFGSKINPYSIDNKVLGDVVVSKVDDDDPSIHFDDIPNQRILGDNRYIAYSGTNAYDTQNKYLITANDNLFNQVFNYIGSTSGEVKIGFGCPAVKRMRIRNEYNYSDANKSAGDHVMFLPMITKQKPEDNGGKNFSKKDSDSVLYNNEETIQYNGKPTLYYYYGISASDFQQKTPTIGSQSQYFYFNFDNVNQKIPFCSPFALTAYRTYINQILMASGHQPLDSVNDPQAMLAAYMQSIYLMLGSTTGVPQTTAVSLILSNDNSFGDTIYTRYHANKYKRFQQSEVLTMKIICTDYDWQQLQINQPIVYNSEIYSILEVSGYDVVRQTAEIKLIKQI